MCFVSDSDEEMTTKWPPNKCYSVEHPEDIRVKGICRVCKPCQDQIILTIANWWNNPISMWTWKLTWLSELRLRNEVALVERRNKRLETVDGSCDMKDIVRLSHTDVKTIQTTFRKLRTLLLENVECLPDRTCGCEKDDGAAGDMQINWYQPMNKTKVTVKDTSPSKIGVKIRGTLALSGHFDGHIRTENVMYAFPITCFDSKTVESVELNSIATRAKNVSDILCSISTLSSIRFVDVLVATDDRKISVRSLTSNIQKLHVEYHSDTIRKFSANKDLMTLEMFSGIMFPDLTNQTFIKISDAEKTSKHFEDNSPVSKPINIEFSQCALTEDLIQNLVESCKGSRLVLKSAKVPRAKHVLYKLKKTKQCKLSLTTVQHDFMTASIEIVTGTEDAKGNEKVNIETRKIPSANIEGFDVPYCDFTKLEYANNNLSHHYVEGIELLETCRIETKTPLRPVGEVFFQDIRLKLISKTQGNPLEVFPEMSKRFRLKPIQQVTSPDMSTLVIIAQEADWSLATGHFKAEQYAGSYENVAIVLICDTANKIKSENLIDSFSAPKDVIKIVTTRQRYVEDLDNVLVEIVFRPMETIAKGLSVLLDIIDSQPKDLGNTEFYIQPGENATIAKAEENKIDIKETLLAILDLYKELGIQQPNDLKNPSTARQEDMAKFKESVLKQFPEGQTECDTRIDTVYVYIDESLEQDKVNAITTKLATLATSGSPYKVIPINNSIRPLASVGACVGNRAFGTLGAFAEDENQTGKLFALLSKHVSEIDISLSDSTALTFGTSKIGTIMEPLNGTLDIALAIINTNYIPQCNKGIKDNKQNVQNCQVPIITNADRRFLNKQVFINGAYTAPGYGIVVHTGTACGLQMLTIKNHKGMTGSRASRPEEKVTDLCTNGDSGSLVIYRDSNEGMFALGMIQGERFYGPRAASGGQEKQFLAVKLHEGLEQLSQIHGGTYTLSQ